MEIRMTLQTGLNRLILAAALGTACLSASAETIASAPDSSKDAHMAAHQERMARHLDERLARQAEILQLTSQQQNSRAWKNYIRASHDMKPQASTPQAGNTDAVTRMRAHADLMSNRAKRLATLADATQDLLKILSEPQKKAFNALMQQQHSGHHAGPGHTIRPHPPDAQ
jgi:hypothetical protein